MHNTSRVTSKGQITIPIEIREQYGLLAHTEVRFEIQRGQIVLLKEEFSNKRSNDLIRKMTSKTTLGMSTDEIMRLTRT